MSRVNTPLVVIDLEATAGTDEDGFQTNHFIIDVGAVYLDESLTIRETFSRLVKPGEPISPFIQELTGITPAMVENEFDFSVIGPEFVRWVESLAGNLKKVRLAAWGNYFDIPLLRKNYQHHLQKFPFSGTAIDVKTIAFLWLSLSGRRTEKVSLEFFAQYYNLKPEGRYHRALTDARLTAEILTRLWKDLEGVFIPEADGQPARLARIVVE